MRKYVILLLAACAALVSCKDSFEFAQPLSVTSERIELEATEGSTPVIVYANGAWTARLTENASWARIENTSGSGLGQVKFFYGANEGLSRKVTLEIASAGTVRTVDMVQKSGFGEVVFAFASKSMSIARNGAAGTVPFMTNLPESELGKVRASVLSDDGTEVSWISGIKVSGTQVGMDIAANSTSADRVAVLTLSYTDNMGKETTSALKLTQKDEAPWLSFDGAVIGERYSSLAATVTLPYTTNLAPYMDGIAAASTCSEPWAKIRFPEDGSSVILVDLEENTASASRTATLTFPFTDDSGVRAPFTFILTQKGRTARLSFEAVKAKVTQDEFLFQEEAAIEGVVISDRDDPNMETAANLSVSELDTSLNGRTAYVQSEDGTSGFRVLFDAASDNLLHRGDKVILDLSGLTILREHDPERYTITGVTTGSVSVQPDRAEPVIREKTLSALADGDVYTLVKVKGLEMSFKHGAYTNCHDGYAQQVNALNPAGGKAGGCGSSSTPQKYDTTPCSMIDAAGGEINLLINNAVTWRRYGNGVPQGLCDVTGILVHSYQPRWARNGWLGRYQLRPSAESDIAEVGSPFSKVIVSWYKEWGDTQLKDDAAKTSGMHPEGVQATFTSNMENVPGYTTLVATATNYNDLTAYNETPARAGYYKGQVSNAALSWRKTGGYFWASDDITDGNAAPWFCLSFSTQGLSGSRLTFVWSAAQGSTRAATDDIQGPTQYRVEYSTDGIQFTAIDHIYAMHPIVSNSGKVTGVFTVPGLHQYVTQLPASLLGQPRVYVRVRAASAVSLDDDFVSPEGGTVKKYTTSNYAMIRFGEWTIQYN